MSDELLTRAARALRERHDGVRAAATATRRNVLTAAAARGRRRRAMVLVLAPLAAVLAISTAWAAATGRLQRWMSPTHPAGSQPTVTTTSAAATPTSTPVPIPSAPVPVSSEPVPVSSASAPAIPIRTEHPTRRGSPQLSDAPMDVEEPMYTAAHRAHFVERDPAAALRAWDAYLAAYPTGRFALEAKYNRALSLVRLGRNDAARDALAPFADGHFGRYRQAEARQLIDALDGGL